MNRAAELVDDIRSNVVERLDYLMLTHLHPDCFSVMFRVLEARPVKGFWKTSTTTRGTGK